MNRSWTVVDFILIWVGGLVGTVAFLSMAVVIEDDDSLIVLGLAGQYVGNLAVFFLLRQRKEAKDVGFRIEGSDIFYIGAGLIFQVAMALLILPLVNVLFSDGRPPRQEIADIIANADSLLLQVGLVLAAVVLAPVTEELLFRGVLLRALERRGKIFAILASSTIFSLVHIFGLDLDTFWQSVLVTLPPLFILGLVLARITQRSGRLGPAIFLHSGWNLLAAFVLLLPTELV